MTNTRNTTKVAAAAAVCGAILAGTAAARPAPNPRIFSKDPEPRVVFGADIERLQRTMLRPNELHGFAPLDCAVTQSDAAGWAGDDLPSTRALRREGFVVGVRESLHSRRLAGSAESAATEFRTAAGAKEEAQRALAHVSATTYPVTGIAGARGYTDYSGTGYGVVFTVGTRTYEIRVQLAWSRPAERADVAAAARSVYRRAI
jgi:hypothetical protein